MATLVTYAANTGVLPDHLSIPDYERWEIEPVPAGDPDSAVATIITGGILHIVDPDPPKGPSARLYSRFDTLNSTDNAIFEINCQVISIGPDPALPETNGVGFGFIDTKKLLEVVLFRESIFAFDKGGTLIVSKKFVTTDKFHTYRIVKNGEGNMQVFADGDMIPLLDIGYDQLPDRPKPPEVPAGGRQVFATSSQESSVWDIAYVSYSISP